MKKYISTLIFLAWTAVIFAQAPQKFNYQAVARNAQGIVLPNQNVKIRASILDGSANGTSQYSETHSTTTSQLGLFTLAIGGGTVVSGNFAEITWANGDKYLKIEMDATGGNNFTLVGTSQLLSVPYALNAKNAENGTDKIAIMEHSTDGNEGCTTTNTGQWNKRCLKTESYNNISSSVSLNSTNSIMVIQPGKYLVRAFGVANYCNGNVLRIRNTLTNEDEIYGTPNFSRSDDVDGENSFSILEGVLTVTQANSQYVMEHWIQSVPTAGQEGKIFGDFPNLPASIPCTWARVVIQKID